MFAKIRFFLKKIGKTFVVTILFIYAVFCIFSILFIVGSFLGPGKDDIALFYGNHYTISKDSIDYHLYKKDHGIILENVTGYYTENKTSYISNGYEIIIINEKNGDYTKVMLSELDNIKREKFKKIN